MQHGIQDFLDSSPIANPPQGQFEPPPSFAQEVMLSDILAERGYRCGYAGLWEMGNDQAPQHHFSDWYSLPGASTPYQNPTMSLNGQKVEEKGNLGDLITTHARQFLDAQQPATPFLLVVSHRTAHPPYDGIPQKYTDLYRNTSFDNAGWEPAAPNALRDKAMLTDTVGNLRKCAAAITALDDQLPPLLAKLQERGLRDNTLIVFTSDDGYLLGRHGLWCDALASDPPNFYEGTVNIPLFFNWPGRAPVQSSRAELVSAYDVLPTICEAIGAPAPQRNLCGRSFLRILQGGLPSRKQPWPNLALGHFRNTDMARDARFKLVLRNGGKGPNELYDERADAREKINQYDNPQFLNTRDSLAKEIAAWKAKYSG